MDETLQVINTATRYIKNYGMHPYSAYELAYADAAKNYELFTYIDSVKNNLKQHIMDRNNRAI